MTTVGIGMLGAGFIGQMHSLTFCSAGLAKQEPKLGGRMIVLADTNRELAAEVQQRYGWETVSTDWRAAVDNPEVRSSSMPGRTTPMPSRASPPRRWASTCFRRSLWPATRG